MSLADELAKLEDEYRHPRSNTINLMPEDWQRLDELCKRLGNAPRSRVLTLALRKLLLEREAQEVQAQRDCDAA